MSLPDPATLTLLIAQGIGLLALSAWFTAAETAVRSLNRNHLKLLADAGNAAAGRVRQLQDDAEGLNGLGLFWRYLALVLLSQWMTLASLHWLGDTALWWTSLLLTALAVTFGAVLPRAFAVQHPEPVAWRASWTLRALLVLCQPIVLPLSTWPRQWLRRRAGGGTSAGPHPLDREELRAAVKSASALVPARHREMLVGLLDLENVTVEDIMVPRQDIVGIDLDQEWVDILDQLTTCRHTRVPCYYGNLDNIAGILHLRNLSRLLRQSREFALEDVTALLTQPHFVPVGANLYAQLMNFQQARQRLGLVVDEYGDIEGLVTLDDLLEQIVGEFTTVPQFSSREVHPQADGSYIVDGTANVREMNRSFGWSLPERGPKTLNGLVLEALENIPESGTSFRLGDYTIEILQAAGHTVRSARIFPPTGLLPPHRGAEDEQLGD